MDKENVVTIRVMKVREGARLPYRASNGATGYDLFASLPDGPVRLGPVPVVIPTGIAMEVPPGIDVQSRPRSGLARKGVMKPVGTIDPDYRGEIFVTMYTTSPEIEHEVQDGDRIAQLVISIACAASFELAVELSDTERGTGGFGSTGR
jgi:dUTP pyrophosphatase